MKDKLLVFVQQNTIRTLPLDEVDSIDSVLPLDGVENPIGLDWDAESNSIFWTDVTAHTISSATINGTEQALLIWTNLGKLFINYIKHK